MTAITITTSLEPVYATIAQISSFNASIGALGDDEKKNLIVKAEQKIDFLVGFHKKYHSQFLKSDPEYAEQRTIFPRMEDYTENDAGTKTPFIPHPIHQATLLLSEILYERDQTASADAELDALLQGADSAKIGDFAITKKARQEGVADMRESLGKFLADSVKGQQVLSWIADYQNLSFEMP